MRSINKVILIGNLTRDPQMKTTANGQPITTFGIATNREWMTKNGERKSLAEYHNVAAWGKLAEICSKFLKKGKLVYVEGYLKTRSWDTDTGVRVFKTEIVIFDMIMLDKRPADYVPTEGGIAGDIATEIDNTGYEYTDDDAEEAEAAMAEQEGGGATADLESAGASIDEMTGGDETPPVA